ncbi:MAG: hypothetical protein K2N78_02995 [Oscillospiraceae bacterium]|nr:hypothetical protein [Oscillospiraceae bacterium]
MSDRAQTIFLICLLVFVVISWLWPYAMALQIEWEDRKKRGEPPDYDERQKLARLQAGNHALYTLLGFLLLWVAVDQIGWFAWTGYIQDMVLCGLMLAWCVWASECILNDAFVSWKNSKKIGPSGSAGIYGTLMLTWTNSFRSSGIIDSWVPACFACGNLVVLLAVTVYKERKDKKLAKVDAGDGAE